MDELKKIRLRPIAVILLGCFFVLLSKTGPLADDQLKDLMEKALSKKADSLFQQGLRYYTKREYQQAIIVFKEALAVYPSHHRARMYLDKSETALEKAEKNRLLSQRRQREKEEELRLKMGEEGRRKQISYHYLKGRELLKDKKYNQAIEEFNKVLLLDPSHSQAKRLLAEAEEKASGREGIEAELKNDFAILMSSIKENEYAEAKEKLTRILSRIEELQEDYKKRNTSLVVLKETERRSNEVMGHLNKEEYARAEEEIGGLLEKISDLASKEEETEKKKVDSGKVKAYFNSALDLIDEGNYDQARFELERIMEIDPENEEAASLLERVKEIVIISGGH